MSDRNFSTPFDVPADAAPSLLDAQAAPASTFSLLGYGNPVLSLLGNLASGGQVGPDQIAGTGDAGSQLSPVQQRVATNALLAAGAHLANAGGAGFGPRQTWAQALTGALATGATAGDEARTRAMLEDQSQQVLAQNAQDAQVRRQLMARQIEQADLANRVIKMGLSGGFGAGRPGGASPALEGAPTDAGAVAPGDAPGAAVRELLAGRESGGGGYGATNAGGYLGRYQIGAGLAADAGAYTPAPNESLKTNHWIGRWSIPGFPDVQTRDDYLRSPGAQDQVYRMAMGHNDAQLTKLGIYDRAAQLGSINGVPLTREGLLAGAWLGGTGSLRQWIDTGGKVDNMDSNRTRVSQYVKLGAGLGDAAGPLRAPSSVQVAANDTSRGTTASDTGPIPIVPAADQPPTVPAPATTPPAGAGGGLPPTPVPRSGAVPAGGPFQLSQQQWAALAMTPFGKQGEALAKMLGEPGGETKTIEDPNTHVHWLWRTDRQGNPVARIGLAPTDPKHVNVLSADGTQLEIHTQLPGGGVGPFVGYAPHTAQITEIAQNGKNVRGVYIPGGGFRPIGDAPLPPEAVPISPERATQNVQQQAGIAGATHDETQARKEQADLYGARDQAQAARPQLDLLKATLDPAGNFRTGALTPAQATVGGYAEALGIQLPGGMSPSAVMNAQVFQKLVTKSTLDQMGGRLGAGISDADRNFVSQTMPQLSNTSAANRAIVAINDTANQRVLEKADRWEAWRNDPANAAKYGAAGPNSNASWRDFSADWSKYVRENPIVVRLPDDLSDADAPARIEALPPGRVWWTRDAKGKIVTGVR